MTRAFEMIGYRGIDEHHVSPPARIAAALSRVLRPCHASPSTPRARSLAARTNVVRWSH